MPSGAKKRRAAKRKKEEEKEKKVAIHHHLPNSPTTPLLSPQGNGHHDLIAREACNTIQGEAKEEDDAMEKPESVGEKAETETETETTQKTEVAEEAVTAEAAEAGVSVPIEQVVEVIEEVIHGRKDILGAVVEEVSALTASTSRESEVKVVAIADKPEETAQTSEGGSAEASPATEAVQRAPLVAPLVADHAAWWKCCGLLDVFASSGR